MEETTTVSGCIFKWFQACDELLHMAHTSMTHIWLTKIIGGIKNEPEIT